MNCPECEGDKFRVIANPNCECADGDGGFTFRVGESAHLPCPHQIHGECVSCGYDVGEWNEFVKRSYGSYLKESSSRFD